MTLKIERISGQRGMQIRLSGELRSENLGQLQAEIESGHAPLVFDLEELALVDVEAVRFLNGCEAAGIPSLKAPPYIREWMIQERAGKKDATNRLEGELDQTGNSKAE